MFIIKRNGKSKGSVEIMRISIGVLMISVIVGYLSMIKFMEKRTINYLSNRELVIFNS
jgi:hypothetical protein